MHLRSSFTEFGPLAAFYGQNYPYQVRLSWSFIVGLRASSRKLAESTPCPPGFARFSQRYFYTYRSGHSCRSPRNMHRSATNIGAPAHSCYCDHVSRFKATSTFAPGVERVAVDLIRSSDPYCRTRQNNHHESTRNFHTCLRVGFSEQCRGIRRRKRAGEKRAALR